jgi:BirA family transcriptional regulator, biotin operon repressor / biotin---[acetyl-CoA-carboxylase] ligase
VSFGALHRHYRRTDSTNMRARELAAAGAPHGTVVTAAEQSAGRGRQGRTWTAPPGKALLYSAILRPLGEPPLSLLPLSVAIAVCETAESLRSGVACGVKWPNDVLLDERKLAGILIETRPQDDWAVVGVGLNLTIEPGDFPSELRETATSLDGDASLEGARSSLDERLEHWLDAAREDILDAWRKRDVLRGREVVWSEGSGFADGVDDRGSLLVIAPGGERLALSAGEVHLTAA